MTKQKNGAMLKVAHTLESGQRIQDCASVAAGPPPFAVAPLSCSRSPRKLSAASDTPLLGSGSQLPTPDRGAAGSAAAAGEQSA